MTIEPEMVAAGLEVFEQYLNWDDYPYDNATLVDAIIRAALRKRPEPKKAPAKPRLRGFDTEGHVYFISDGARIKIGKANDVAAGMSGLQTSSPSPPELLGALSGGRRIERELHRKFAHHRVRGEWFDDCEEIRTYISEAVAGGNDNNVQN